MGEVEYYGSRNLLNRVWINLIDSAIKFPPDHSKIKLKLHRSDTFSIFHILDNSCGMSEETNQYIFDHFYQGGLSHTMGDNGIGLTVTERIIRLHGGNTTVHSEEGTGAALVVTPPDIQPRNT